tara:strand:- start:5725 stop:6141 length:417 start_codon:yes stop_codon:yes gene_type:complete
MEKVTIFTSGLSQGNPGPAAIGVCVVDAKSKILGEISESIGNATDDYAAYFAAIKGLQLTVDLFGEKTTDMEFELRLDNKVVKEQINSECQITHPGLVPYFVEIHNLRVSHFPRLRRLYVLSKNNKKAGDLVSKVLDA